jgi:probable phosphomutase (TIGR03848 family)
MRLFVISRHGESKLNEENRVNGDPAVPVALTDKGRDEGRLLGQQLAHVPLDLCVHSRFGRTLETAQIALAGRSVSFVTEPLLDDIDVGELEGRTLDDYRNWKRAHTRADPFPGGESLAAMQARSVAAIRRLDARFESEHGPGAVWAAVSHGDIIKSILADAYGMHLDLFQRISVGPASVSIVRYGQDRPDVISTNTDAGDLSWLRSTAPAGDAPVGGGAGPEAAAAS